MQKDKLRNLLQRYASGNCTPKERKFLEDMVLRNPILKNWDWSSEEEMILTGIKIKKGIKRQIKTKNITIRRLKYLTVAASVVLVIGLSWFKWDHYNTAPNRPVLISEKASSTQDNITLMLADGSILNLERLKTGLVHDINGLAISKPDSGQVVYKHIINRSSRNSGRERVVASNNTIRVPNGKKFQLTLPDGTRVWLNAASTLTYPVPFVGNQRNVTLGGEAYFEVAHNKKMPFTVMANGTQIIVTGTHFNVSAYNSDKSVRTTLFDGGVKIGVDKQQVSLTPGYEAITYTDGSPIIRQTGNPDQVLAWKNGYFIFDNMDIVAIMRSVARWYNITVYVKGEIPAKKIGGTFPVTAELDELLHDLGKLANIEIKRNGKEVVIK